MAAGLRARNLSTSAFNPPVRDMPVHAQNCQMQPRPRSGLGMGRAGFHHVLVSYLLHLPTLSAETLHRVYDVCITKSGATRREMVM